MRKRLYVKQRDRSDCGAACLASLSAFYGLYLPVSRIRQYAGTDQSGTSLQGLVEAAGHLHLKARAARAKEIPVHSIPLPSIFHVVLENDMQHFVVVFETGGKMVHYMDPAFGKMMKRPVHVFEKSWTGIILMMIPSEDFKPVDNRVKAGWRIWELVRTQRVRLLLVLSCSIICTFLGLTMSLYVQRMIDSVLPGRNLHLMNLLSVWMIILLCFKIILGYLRSLFALQTGRQIDARLILGFYNHLLTLPQRFFDCMRVGEIISRVNDAVRIRAFVNEVAIGVVVHLLTILFCLSAAFFYNRNMGILMLMSIPFYYFIYWLNNRDSSKWQREMMICSAALESQFVESIQCMTTIRRFEVAPYFRTKTEKRFVPMMRALFKSSQIGLVFSNISEWISGFVTIFLLWIGSRFVVDKEISAGELISIYTLMVFFTQPVLAIIDSAKRIQDALIAADRLYEITDLTPEKESETTMTGESFIEGDLIFSQVGFRYGPGIQVFTSLNMRIPQSQMTAIAGASGSGKSTLISLVQKLYPLDEGTISIGDKDLRDIPASYLRKRVTAVPQYTDLFEGTVLSNIALGQEEPDLNRIIEISRQLGIHEFITRLPNQYQTVIREQGLNLSGGQRQRIGIARALYPCPAIVMLDEATSALDPESEQFVHETLRSYQSGGTTLIVIAHRLSTIRKCDSIIFLNQGKVASSGTHEWLMSENHAYQHWVRLNSL